jgi:hypothetical protein
MPRRTRSQLANDARFVFRGTVKRMKASADRDIRPSPRTATVRVDEVVEAPESLADLTGQEITVQFESAPKLRAGQQAIFYTNAWLFGETIAVQSVLHQVLDTARPGLATAAAAAAEQDAATNLHNKDAKARFDRADMVASGRVVSVSLPNGGMAPTATSRRGRAAAGVRATAAAASPPGAAAGEELLSEHAPLWRDATIEVNDVHKGTAPSREVVVRFPASTDVMWFKAPKLHVGQEGLFMLHTGELDTSKRAGVAAAAAAPAERVFTALHPADYQPFDQAGGIRHAIATATNAPVEPANARLTPPAAPRRRRKPST